MHEHKLFSMLCQENIITCQMLLMRWYLPPPRLHSPIWRASELGASVLTCCLYRPMPVAKLLHPCSNLCSSVHSFCNFWTCWLLEPNFCVVFLVFSLFTVGAQILSVASCKDWKFSCWFSNNWLCKSVDVIFKAEMCCSYLSVTCESKK
jgi:hypothetical protein